MCSCFHMRDTIYKYNTSLQIALLADLYDRKFEWITENVISEISIFSTLSEVRSSCLKLLIFLPSAYAFAALSEG